MGNDANVGLLGEWVAGAARGHDDVLGLRLGTGIGGGLILHGRPYDRSFGAAGEIGHVIVHAGGALCSCGRRGCVEAYAGRRMMAGAAHAMVEAGRSTDLFEIQRDEGKSRPTSKVWARALEEEDELATQLFDAAIDAIAVGVGSVANLLDVSLVVVGGGMAEKLGQDLADRIFEASRPWMLHPNPKLCFAVSSLGDDAGVVGAAALARAEVISAELGSQPRWSPGIGWFRSARGCVSAHHEDWQVGATDYPCGDRGVEQAAERRLVVRSDHDDVDAMQVGGLADDGCGVAHVDQRLGIGDACGFGSFHQVGGVIRAPLEPGRIRSERDD